MKMEKEKIGLIIKLVLIGGIILVALYYNKENITGMVVDEYGCVRFGSEWCGSKYECIGGEEECPPISPELLEENCIESGGRVLTKFCCGAIGDFPDMSIIGVCECSQPNSHEIKICDCGLDGYFNGIICVAK